MNIFHTVDKKMLYRNELIERCRYRKCEIESNGEDIDDYVIVISETDESLLDGYNYIGNIPVVTLLDESLHCQMIHKDEYKRRKMIQKL